MSIFYQVKETTHSLLQVKHLFQSALSKILAIIYLVFTSIVLHASAPDYSENVRKFIVHNEPVILIKNVRLVDGSGKPAIEDASILINDGRINKIGKASDFESIEALIIDGTGQTVLPGFVMLHEHLLYLSPNSDPWSYTTEHLVMPPLYLAAGTTSARTGGTFHAGDDLRTKELIEQGVIAGPDMFVTAPFIEGQGSFSYQMRVFKSEPEVREFVRYWVSAGASSFKAYMNVNENILSAAIDEAHKLNVKVTGHLCSVTFADAARLGIDNLEHGLSEASDVFPNKEKDKCPYAPLEKDVSLRSMENPIIQELIEVLVKHKVAITSTLPVFAAGVHPEIPTQESLNVLSPRSKLMAQSKWAEYINKINPQLDELQMKQLKQNMAFEKAFVEAGGTLLVGTDPTGWGGTLPPNSTHAALILLVEAGFTPLETITIATLNGAKYLGIDSSVGTIQNGKRANLILVDGEPDKNINDIKKIKLVFKDGVAFEPEALINSVQGKLGR